MGLGLEWIPIHGHLPESPDPPSSGAIRAHWQGQGHRDRDKDCTLGTGTQGHGDTGPYPPVGTSGWNFHWSSSLSKYRRFMILFFSSGGMKFSMIKYLRHGAGAGEEGVNVTGDRKQGGRGEERQEEKETSQGEETSRG